MKKQLFTVTKVKWLTQFEEMIAVYIENHSKLINKKMQCCWLLKWVENGVLNG
jgi:hypothetical protein